MDGRKVKEIQINANESKSWPGEEIPVPGTYITTIQIEGKNKPIIRKILVLR